MCADLSFVGQNPGHTCVLFCRLLSFPRDSPGNFPQVSRRFSTTWFSMAAKHSIRCYHFAFRAHYLLHQQVESESREVPNCFPSHRAAAQSNSTAPPCPQTNRFTNKEIFQGPQLIPPIPVQSLAGPGIKPSPGSSSGSW